VKVQGRQGCARHRVSRRDEFLRVGAYVGKRHCGLCRPANPDLHARLVTRRARTDPRFYTAAVARKEMRSRVRPPSSTSASQGEQRRCGTAGDQTGEAAVYAAAERAQKPTRRAEARGVSRTRCAIFHAFTKSLQDGSSNRSRAQPRGCRTLCQRAASGRLVCTSGSRHERGRTPRTKQIKNGADFASWRRRCRFEPRGQAGRRPRSLCPGMSSSGGTPWQRRSARRAGDRARAIRSSVHLIIVQRSSIPAAAQSNQVDCAVRDLTSCAQERDHKPAADVGPSILASALGRAEVHRSPLGRVGPAQHTARSRRREYRRHNVPQG